MPRWKAIVFGLATCERMLPGFHAFAEPIGYEGEDVLREALDIAWEMLGNGEDRRDLMQAAEACDSVAPDMDDHGDADYGSAAMYAACAVAHVMAGLSNDDMVRHAAVIASEAIDVVDLLSQEADDTDSAYPEGEVRVLAHPLMQSELRRQREDLEFLEALDNDIVAAMPDVLRRWKGTDDSIVAVPA
jgi:uncharacterized protein YjaG (DUF416 family)